MHIAFARMFPATGQPFLYIVHFSSRGVTTNMKLQENIVIVCVLLVNPGPIVSVTFLTV